MLAFLIKETIHKNVNDLNKNIDETKVIFIISSKYVNMVIDFMIAIN